MTRVYCFSGSGHSWRIAKSIADHSGLPIIAVDGRSSVNDTDCTTAIVVFPVYCQNIPDPVKTFLEKLQAEYIVLAATYGKMSHGNVLCEAQRLVSGTVIAGAFIPTGHTYLPDDTEFSAEMMHTVFERISAPQRAVIPPHHKDILADIFPAWRSRIGVKIKLRDNCSQCGRCTDSCPMHAITNGRISGNCIRCMRCVHNCPAQALEYTLHPLLARYLSRTREDRIKIFL